VPKPLGQFKTILTVGATEKLQEAEITQTGQTKKTTAERIAQHREH
jgi:hypothetical protein